MAVESPIPFPDPSAARGSDAQRLAVFRDVRDRIAAWIDDTFDADDASLFDDAPRPDSGDST
jgi:hypothetical protein